MKNEVLLRVDGLTIGFLHEGQTEPVVNKLSFTLGEGEILGIVGESGSGKSTVSLAIMGLLSHLAQIKEGKIFFENQELISASSEDRRKQKGSLMSMIFQEPMTSFNPVMTIGAQVEEMLRLHVKCSPGEYKDRTVKALREAGLEEPETIYEKYPHQLSGGMRQRAMIAMAMIAKPKLLIADEPTTALDVTIQDKILKLLKSINEDYNTAIILISHDLGVIKSICGRAIVMKDGTIVESGSADEIFLHPKTEYTKELVAAAPVTWIRYRGMTDKAVRISNVMDEASHQSILKVENLNVSYTEGKEDIFRKKRRKQVVKDVSLTIYKGEALGIVGESGCGKTTLAKAIAGLIKDVQGKVLYADCSNIRPQMVFQDPYGSLNPAKKIKWIIEEPLRIHGGLSKAERMNKIMEIISQVGLEEKHLNRYVSQLSGGQRQRVALAAALILNPKVIILDEPVSSLDVTVQAQILSLLKKLQQKYQLSYLFISHDLNVIYQICDRVCVMYKGEIVETRNTGELFFNPEHYYSRELLEASILQ